MAFFRAKPPVSLDELDWLLACFSWLHTVLEDTDVPPALALPDDPAIVATKSGSELFEVVRGQCGMEDWPCRLEIVDDSFDPGDICIQNEGSTACGTFSIEQGEAVIRYARSQLADRAGLAATFAHELCHYLLASAGDPPGGPELMEHSTDCAAAYLGFGVLLANNAREFGQFTDGEWSGWRASTRGYLSEQALATATALFVRLHGYDPSAAERCLKSYLRKDFRRAIKYLDREVPEIREAMAAVDLIEWNYV